MTTPHWDRGFLLLQQGRPQDAVREFQKHLLQDPDNGQVHALLALCLMELRDLAGAEQHLIDAQRLAPDLTLVYLLRSDLAGTRRDFHAAKKWALEARQLDPTEVGSYSRLAACEAAAKNWQAALEHAERGLQLDPDNAACLNLRVQAALGQGQTAAAARYSNDLLARDPDNPIAQSNRGWVALEQNDPATALQHFRETLRRDPEQAAARQGMVLALKARYVIYRLLLNYTLWMSKFTFRAQIALIVVLYILQQSLAQIAQQSPALAPWAWTAFIGLLAFVYLTWVADPLFNLVLCCSKFGRLALERDQFRGACLFGAGVLVWLGVALVWVVQPTVLHGIFLLLWSLALLPVTSIFRIAWPGGRWIVALYSVYVVGATLAIFATVWLDLAFPPDWPIKAWLLWNFSFLLRWAPLISTLMPQLLGLVPAPNRE